MPTKPILKSYQRVLITVAGALLLAALYLGGMFALKRSPMLNFEVVEKGRLLRSAQPRPGDLDRIYRAEGIGTIISLRGGEEPELKPWAKQHGVAMLSMQMWADHPPTPGQVGLFFDIMRGDTIDLERYHDVIVQTGVIDKSKFFNFRLPVLLHCQGGSDRTGVMVALYRMAFQGWGVKLAEEEMTARFHLTSQHPDQFKFLEQIAPVITTTYGSRSRHVPATGTAPPAPAAPAPPSQPSDLPGVP